MGTVNKSEGGAGFAVVEAVLVLVIVAGVIGAGAYVYSTHHKKSTTDASLTSSSSTNQAVPLNGTTSSINQLTQQDAQVEGNVDKSADAQSQATAASANTAASNVGGAYNENNL